MAASAAASSAGSQPVLDHTDAGNCISLLKTAVTQLVGDESLQCGTEGSTRCLTLANTLLQISMSPDTNQRQVMSEFASWLVESLVQVVSDSVTTTLNREKMWTKFHVLRSSKEFRDKWEKFFKSFHMMSCPIFYQHVTTNVMEHAIKLKLPLSGTDSTSLSESPVLTYEEESAIRYVGGYVVKSLKEKFGAKDELSLALDDLCVTDDNVEPAESEEWLCAIDRGGLTRISDDAYLFFVSVEVSVRRHFHIGNTHKMNNTFREDVTKDTLNDDNVQFYWCITSAHIPQDCVDRLLEEIVRKGITIRGFSFAKSVLEMYTKVKSSEKKFGRNKQLLIF